MQIRRRCLVLLGVFVLVGGCGGRDANLPKLMLVNGTITLDGKPLSGVAITFIPVGATRGTGAAGASDKSGKYELLATRGKGAKGAPAGDYQVMAEKLVMSDGSDYPFGATDMSPTDPGLRQVLPAKYRDARQSPLKAAVHDGENTIDFSLSSKP